MNKEYHSLTTGFIIAPLFGPVAAVFLILLFGNNPDYHFELHSFIKEIPGILFLFLLFGAPIAYLVAGLVGIPLFLVCRRYKLINVWSVTLGGAVTAVLPLLILHLYHGHMYEDPAKSAADLYLFISGCGFIVGIVFWLISGLGDKA